MPGDPLVLDDTISTQTYPANVFIEPLFSMKLVALESGRKRTGYCSYNHPFGRDTYEHIFTH